MKSVVLSDEKELIFREKKDFFSSRNGRSQYEESCQEIIVKTDEKQLCVGLCFTNTFTGQEEFVQYSSQCILFFQGNSITKQYRLTRVFDLEKMQSMIMTKEEVKETYDIDLPTEIKNPVLSRKRRISREKRLAYSSTC